MSADPLWIRLIQANSRWSRRLYKERPVLGGILSALSLSPVIALIAASKLDSDVGRVAELILDTLGVIVIVGLAILGVMSRRSSTRRIDAHLKQKNAERPHVRPYE